MTPFALDDTLLVSYLDGELDPTTARLVEEQFDADPAVRERMAMLQASDEMLRAALALPEQADVPPALQAKVVNLIKPRSRILTRRAFIPLAAAAAVGAFMVADHKMPWNAPAAGGSEETVAHVLEEIADYHGVYAFETEHLVEVPASRQAELESWLSNRIRFAFAAPDLRARELVFRGGRLLGIERQPVAQLMYAGRDGTVVGLCIALTANEATSPMLHREDDDQTTFGRGVGHHVFAAVGPSNNPNLRAIAESMPDIFHRAS